MGTQPSIAQAIRDRGADYILSVKGNQLTLAESMEDFFATFQATPDLRTHRIHSTKSSKESRPRRSASLLRLQPDDRLSPGERNAGRI